MCNVILFGKNILLYILCNTNMINFCFRFGDDPNIFRQATTGIGLVGTLP